MISGYNVNNKISGYNVMLTIEMSRRTIYTYIYGAKLVMGVFIIQFNTSFYQFKFKNPIASG